MALTKDEEIRKVHGLDDEQIKNIINFLQGAVYCWCKNRKDEWFSLRDLMGGDNYYWEGTPLLPLYLKYEGKTDDPVNEAGKAAGWLLKHVIAKDKRLFDTKKESLIRKYCWVESPKNT